MGYYLLDHKNPNGSKFYASRGVKKRYIVVHTAENLPDIEPPDLGAENIARYLAGTSRDASYHEVVDVDSFVPLLPDDYVAWHCRGYNSAGYGLSLATQAAKWNDLPASHRDQLYRAGATRARRAALALGIPMTKVAPGHAGFFGHGEADPTRRSDPGANFDWGYFIHLVNHPDTGVTPSPAPAPAPQPAPAPHVHRAPAFPLPRGWYFGPRSGPRESVSGYYGYRSELRRWQQRMRDRGWDIGVDGLYGPNTAEITRKFQAEKRLVVDGKIGANTWRMAWEAPVT